MPFQTRGLKTLDQRRERWLPNLLGWTGHRRRSVWFWLLGPVTVRVGVASAFRNTKREACRSGREVHAAHVKLILCLLVFERCHGNAVASGRKIPCAGVVLKPRTRVPDLVQISMLQMRPASTAGGES